MPDPDPDDLLLSDDERLHALNVVGSHFAAGRLDTAEFYDRSGEIAAARTLGQVHAPFRGLPGGVPLRNVGGQVEVVATTEREASVINEEDELTSLRRRGDVVETLDWVIVGVTLMAFLILQFVFDLSYAWIVWPSLALTLSVPRLILRYSDEDEEVYEELKESDATARKERIRLAAERIRELER